LKAAGQGERRRTNKWTRAGVIEAIREDRVTEPVQRAASRLFGSVEAARLEALDDSPVNNRLRELREAAGLAQRELGASAGRTGRWVSLVEQGRLVPRLPEALRLAAALNRDVRDIFWTA